MNITLYPTLQLIIACFAIGALILQLILFGKIKKEKGLIWSLLFALCFICFSLCEVYTSTPRFPQFGRLASKLQHSALSMYAFLLVQFWVSFLNETRLRKYAHFFLGVSLLCVFSIWFTPFHLSGDYTLMARTAPESMFELKQWDFSDIGSMALLETISVLAAHIVILVYLSKTPLKYIQKEKKIFMIAVYIELLCGFNDFFVWNGIYSMFFILGIGNLAIIYSFIYLLASKHYNIYLEAEKLNKTLENTVRDRTSALENLNKNLEEEVEKRTDELMKKEAQIAHTTKMESLGFLASGIAHDMNNILMGITGNLQLLKLNDLRNGAEENVNSAVEHCFQVKGLIQRLQKFVTQKEDKLHLENIEDSLKLALMFFKGSASFIQTRISAPQEPVFAYIEQTSLVSLLLNLFINANHAMDGKGVITISYEETTLPNSSIKRPVERGRYLHLTVSDTGKGIPDESIDNVWKPFFTTKKAGVGTGLGLAVARDIIKTHCGEIWLESEVDKGTTFHILLRAGTPGINDEFLSPYNESLPGQLRIMLVEDRKGPMEIVKGFLNSFGYRPEVFQNGREAYQHFSRNHDTYDILLTDYALPEMNGIELAEKCKEIRPGFPVVLFSGNIDSSMGSEHVEAFLRKPFSPVELKNTLVATLSMKN